MGKFTYIGYLARRPMYFVYEPIRDFGDIMAASYRNYAAHGFRPNIISRHGPNMKRVSLASKYFFFSVCILISIFLCRWQDRQQMILFSIVMAGTAIVHLLVAWHEDAMEVYRHCLPAGIQFEFAVIFAAVAVFDQLLMTMSERLSNLNAA